MKAKFTVVENNDANANFKGSDGNEVSLERFQLKGILTIGGEPSMADFTLYRSDFKPSDYPVSSTVDVDVSVTHSAKHKQMIVKFNGLAA